MGWDGDFRSSPSSPAIGGSLVLINSVCITSCKSRALFADIDGVLANSSPRQKKQHSAVLVNPIFFSVFLLPGLKEHVDACMILGVEMFD